MIIGDISEIDRLDPRLLGLCTDIESQAANDSASRSAMRSSFLSQMLVLKGSTPRRLVTLAEREYAKYTMSITMPCDGNVIKVLNKYPRYQGGRSFNKNPETTIIYENLETGEIGSIRVPSYHCNHKVFGFEYELNPILKSIGPGSFLAKDTILADSPSVKDGDYWFGAEVNTAFLSVPGIIEDGIVVSESFCKQFRTYCYGSKTIEWGHDCFPLNLYGTDDDYKIFPDIGEEVRKDGVLFATRQYDPILAVNNMTKTALRKIDHSFDNVTYISLSSVNEDEMPVIEDVNVWHTHNTDLWRTPPQMEKQVRKYHDASKIYNTEINRVYEELLSKRKQTLKTTDEFHALLVRCRINDNNIPRAQLPKSVIRTFRKNKLDDWRVEVSYGWTMTPGNQTKDSDMHGGKGVIVSVWKDEDMPIDDNGVRVDMIVDGSSTLRRTNFGRFNEHYINATSAYIEKQLKIMLDAGKEDDALALMLDYYNTVSPYMYQRMMELLPTKKEQLDHLRETIYERKMLRIWLPTNSPNIGSQVVKDLMDKFPLPTTPVTFRDKYGTYRTTKDILIGSLYIIALEKIGDDWGATSLPKRQHHGIPGKITDTDKSSLPWRDQAFKVFGESEVRLMMGVLEPEFVSSLINFANSPAMCMEAAESILTAERPTDIDMAINYRENASTPGRSTEFFNHILETSGIKVIKGEPYNEQK